MLRNQFTRKVSPIVLVLSLSLASPALAEPGTGEALPDSEIIPGKFIVLVNPNVSPKEIAREFKITPERFYNHAINGFAGAISEGARAGLMKDGRVKHIEPDRVVKANGSQLSPPWGLDRIDQLSLPLNQGFTFSATGLGVTAYIIDTGVRYSHQEFKDSNLLTATRASFGFDAFADGQGGADCNGHGTHVAGTVAGTSFGVAKNAKIVAVRVLDCAGSGSTSGVIAGIDWVKANRKLPAVANLSLGGSPSTALDTAVSNLIASGVATAVAAGNSNTDACKSSPARVASAMTVAASDSIDNKASFSNYGQCIDWFAPGVNIKSSWYTSDTSQNTISGTSMASPHTAGVAAQYLELNPLATPNQVQSAIYSLLSKTRIIMPKSQLRTTPNNHLLFTNF